MSEIKETNKPNYIKIENLKDGYLYKINARNASIGIWNAIDKGFIIAREKFGSTFLFMEYHYDTGAPYGTVMPVREIEKADVDISTFNGFFTESKDSIKILKYLLTKNV